MDINLNNKLVISLLENIPERIKPVAYLTELLQLSRESTYRRLRSEIPFTIEEAVKIAMDLNFSIDNIFLGETKDYASFGFFQGQNAPSDYQSMLKKCYTKIENIVNAETAEVFLSLNRLLPILLVFNDNVFKFTYYKWIQQNNLSEKQTFSELEIPKEIIALQRKIQLGIKEINNSTLILDPNIFLSLIRDIQYYYQRKLISDEELCLLKQEVLDLIDFFEKIARTGVCNPATNVYIYLSFLYINANVGYIHYNQITESLLWIFTANPTIIHNQKFSEIQKSWIDSLKRQSTLISQSNEIFQIEFFNKQREYLDQKLKTKTQF